MKSLKSRKANMAILVKSRKEVREPQKCSEHHKDEKIQHTAFTGVPRRNE